MEKPYDEVEIPRHSLPDSSILRDRHIFMDWLKYRFEADEVECFENATGYAITVRYKRYQLQYG